MLSIGSTSNLTQEKLLYRAVVFLNNTAVTLMQKHCYRQAQEVLRSAVDLSAKASNIPSFEAELNTSTALALRYAQQSICNPLPSPTTVEVHVMSDDDPYSSLDFSYGSLVGSTLVRINETTCNELLSSCETPSDKLSFLRKDIIAATVCYNFGCSFLPEAYLMTYHDQTRSDILSKTGAVLKLSAHILSVNRQRTLSDDRLWSHDYTLLFVLQLQTMADVSVACGDENELRCCLQALDVIVPEAECRLGNCDNVNADSEICYGPWGLGAAAA